jgi:hypothetical protein
MADLVTIRHVSDPVEAEMLVDLLAQEGITAVIPGKEHNAMMGGLIASALQMPLKVPEDQAERALEVISALEEYDEVDPHDAGPNAPEAMEHEGGGPYRGGPARDDSMPPRKKRVAIAAGLFLPMVFGCFGGAHFYVRSYTRGFALMATAWFFAYFGLSGYPLAWFVPALVVIVDIIGALGLIDALSKD